MIRVRTGSRLHFGLFSLPSEQAGPWLNQEGLPTIPRRQFGGVGLMIEKPGIELTLEDAEAWAAEGPLAERALHFAQTYATRVGLNGCYAIRISRAAPEHVGLGTGTQLGLTVAAGLADLANMDPHEKGSASLLAKRIGRGLRSAIGIVGFQLGGLIVDAGKQLVDDTATAVAFGEVPEYWKCLVVIPHALKGAHGRAEMEMFHEISKRSFDDRTTDTMCRIVLLGMLPAIKDLDLQTFGEAVYDYNRRAGELFRPVQGGIYSNAQTLQTISAIRAFGIKGVAQSSWGPSVVAIAEHDALTKLMRALESSGLARAEEMLITEPRNAGAVLSTEY
jgi:beta-RFAP synthase